MEIEEFNLHIVSLRHELLVAARRLSRDEDLAEDYVQEVLLKLWTKRDMLKQHPNYKALAFKMIRNVHIDNWRHKQLEVSIGETRDIAATDEIEKDDNITTISKIIETLPPLQARVFKMKELQGYDYEEIALILGCNEESLRQNISRARKRIREEFIRIQTKANRL
jgi:RNA polymerase sigma-70 factor (ECF subfamily)